MDLNENSMFEISTNVTGDHNMKALIAYRTSVCQRMQSITHSALVYMLTYAGGTLGIGCIRFKHGRIR